MDSGNAKEVRHHSCWCLLQGIYEGVQVANNTVYEKDCSVLEPPADIYLQHKEYIVFGKSNVT